MRPPTVAAPAAVTLAALALAAFALAGCAQQDALAAPAQSAPVPSVVDDGVVRTAGCVHATTTPAMSIDGTPQPANQEALDNVAQRIIPPGEGKFAAVYAGVRMVQERDRIQVFRKPSADFDGWLLREFAADCVEAIDAKYSAVELGKLQDRVNSDLAYWSSHGVKINTMGTDFVRGVIIVGTLDVDKARELVPARYPGTPIEVEKEGPLSVFG
jgi:hypothetical protein